MGLFVWECSVEKMWDWGQGIVLVSEGPSSWEGFYVRVLCYRIVHSCICTKWHYLKKHPKTTIFIPK